MNKQKFERWQRVNEEIDQVHKIVEQIAESKVPKAISGLLRLVVRARYTNIIGVCVDRNDYIWIPAGLQKDIAPVSIFGWMTMIFAVTVRRRRNNEKNNHQILL